MDSRLKNWRRTRLSLRDSVPSASLLPLPTGAVSQLNNSTGSGEDGPLPFNKGSSSHRTPTKMDNSGNNNSKSMSNSSSALPEDCSTKNLRPMVQGCQFLNENDGSLQYSDGWIFTTSDPNGLVHTVHFTQAPGTSVSLSFNASSVIVFGLLPSGSSPPQASYSIDGLPPTSSHMATTSACIPNQQLFNSGTLDAGLHNLTINVTVASPDQPYILDYLWLCGAGAATSEGSTADTERHSKSSKAGIIVAGVLGAVALLLAIAICVWLYVRRRRNGQARLRKLQLHLSPSPVASWLYWNSQSDERRSMFTSSEDILANNPTHTSSSGTQKGMGYRKPPPPIILPPPPTARMSTVSKTTSASRPASYDPPGLEDTGWYPRRMERAPSLMQA